MKPNAPLVAIAALFAGMSASYPAYADGTGVCKITPALVQATFGFSAQGQALAGNLLGIPPGAFAQTGTATGQSATQSGTAITGRWSTVFEQNDSSAKLTIHTFAGNYTVSTTSCTGDFSWDKVGVVFHAVFVDQGNEFRSISTLPGLIISYASGKKL